MRKGQIVDLKIDEVFCINQHGHKIVFKGYEDEIFLLFQYCGDSKILIPKDRKQIKIMKNKFEVLKHSNEEVQLKYLGRE